MLPLVRQSGGDVMSFDWRIHLDDARKQIGTDTPVQGNLDPNILFAPLPVIKEKVLDVLKRAEGRPGHIFNLGHGITPDVDPEHAGAFIRAVTELSPEYHLQD